ncbi:DUF6747 family protein [Spongiivirga citrea]|uniref:Uncharacterized protein n=1 Tax=Spongiivirga citrea TaxID=1481457 RepID=A0A6M0CHC2_9FLAO|nr:DUF6747 family protein [Spongiivirga citrea]NER17235.1 hypothetical protein [Spongiivirga citrea]
MSTLLLFKNLYSQAFEALKTYQLYVLKAFSYAVMGFIALGIFAFIYRVFTGFFMIG